VRWSGVEWSGVEWSGVEWRKVRRPVKILHVNRRPDLCVTFEV
jgi:hypothetical protein